MPSPGDSSSQHHESKRVKRDDSGNVMQSFSSSSFGDDNNQQTEKKIHVKLPAGMQPCTKAVVYVMKRHQEDEKEIAANKECFQAIVDEDKKRVVVREYGAKFAGMKKETGASDMAQRKDSNEHSFNLPFAVDKTSVKNFHYTPQSGDLVLDLKAKQAASAPEESAQDFFSGAGDAD